MQFVATIIIEVDEHFENRKPDVMMIKNYLESKIIEGNINQKCFRGNIVFNIIKTRFGVVSID